MVRVWPPKGSNPSGNGYANSLGEAELDSIQSFQELSNSEESRLIAEEIAGRALEAPGLTQMTDGAKIKNEQQLRSLIEDRVDLILDPEYEKFVSHIEELLGRDGNDALQGTMFADKGLWERFSGAYKYAGVSVDSVRSTLDLSSVTIHQGLWGGAATDFTDPGLYGTADLNLDAAKFFSVSVPLMIQPENTPDAKIMVVWGILSFVWVESKQKWLPYRNSVYDPSGTLEQVPPLWI